MATSKAYADATPIMEIGLLCGAIAPVLGSLVLVAICAPAGKCGRDAGAARYPCTVADVAYSGLVLRGCCNWASGCCSRRRRCRSGAGFAATRSTDCGHRARKFTDRRNCSVAMCFDVCRAHPWSAGSSHHSLCVAKAGRPAHEGGDSDGYGLRSGHMVRCWTPASPRAGMNAARPRNVPAPAAQPRAVRRILHEQSCL
jgi:hypothetical protein